MPVNAICNCSHMSSCIVYFGPCADQQKSDHSLTPCGPLYSICLLSSVRTGPAAGSLNVQLMHVLDVVCPTVQTHYSPEAQVRVCAGAISEKDVPVLVLAESSSAASSLRYYNVQRDDRTQLVWHLTMCS